MWFFFFSMIKRILQPSKSMLSSNLCKTGDLILNRFYNEAVGIIQISAASYRISVYQIILLNSLKSQNYVVSLKTKI